MNLTEQQFLKDIKSYAKVKQHEQKTTIDHLKPIPTIEFAKGSKKAWMEIEFLLGRRLEEVEVME